MPFKKSFEFDPELQPTPTPEELNAYEETKSLEILEPIDPETSHEEVELDSEDFEFPIDGQDNLKPSKKKSARKEFYKNLRQNKFKSPFYTLGIFIAFIFIISIVFQLSSKEKLEIDAKISYGKNGYGIVYDAEKIPYKGVSKKDDIIFVKISDGTAVRLSLDKQKEYYPAKVLDNRDGFLYLSFDFPHLINDNNFKVAFNSNGLKLDYISKVKVTLKFVNNKYNVVSIIPRT